MSGVIKTETGIVNQKKESRDNVLNDIKEMKKKPIISSFTRSNKFIKDVNFT